MGIPMWLAAMFALDVAGTLDASDSARVYAREATAGGDAAMDVENAPRLALSLDWPTAALELEYMPRLFWSDVGGPEASPALLLHTGAVRLSSRRERLRIAIAQTFAIGDQSFARLSFDRQLGPGGSEAELVPGFSVVRIIEAQTSASLRYAWSRRVSTELRPSLGVSGGENAAAQAVLPRQQTARVEALLDYRSSLRDTLTTEASFERADISNGYDHRITSLMETWSRTFAIDSGTALGAGFAVQTTEPPDAVSDTELQPIGLARIWHALLLRAVQVRLGSEVGYEPYVHVLTGPLQRRLYASADMTATAGDTRARLALGAAQTFPLERPDTARSISADLALEQALLEWLSAEVGGQLVWQTLGDRALDASDPLWMVFAGAQARLPSARF
jgi:hypothetical protein